MKTLVIYPGQEVEHDSPFYLLDPETGEVLASHFCSHSLFAKGDLHDNRKDRLEEWEKEYGMKTEAKFVEETNYKWEDIYAKNQALAKQATEES